jgi:hypothetical protein
MKRGNTVRSAYPFGATPAQYLEHHTMPLTECGCMIWMGPMSKRTGYGQMAIKRRPLMPHRVAWEVANGPIPEGMFVLHRCDIRTCINPEHLFLGTHKENMRDMAIKKRAAFGIDNGSAKLSPKEVSEIRGSLLANSRLAELYGVSTGTISNIKRMKNWRHVA